MSGNPNSGRRPEIVRPDFNPVVPPTDPAPPPALSPGAAAHWPTVLSQAKLHCALTDADGMALGALCELLATLDLVIAQKSKKRFSAFSAKGMRVLRTERQTLDGLAKYFKKFRLDPEAREKLKPGRASGSGSVRDFARSKGSASA